MEKLKALALAAVVGLMLAFSTPAFAETKPVDVNTASVEELVELNGIGPAKAKAIVDHREHNGKFANVEDLRSVSGIGGALLERLRPQVTVGESEEKEAK